MNMKMIFLPFFVFASTLILSTPNANCQGMQLDHIILAIDDLETGVREFEEKTGIRAIYGGVHPDNNTQNAIISLEDGVYIEILAPEDNLDTIPDFF